MQAAKITRKRGAPALPVKASVIVVPPRVPCCHCFVRSKFWMGKARRHGLPTRLEKSGRLGEVGLLGGGLVLVDRTLSPGRRQRYAHGHVSQARLQYDLAGDEAAVELVKILHAHQRPGVA